MTDNEGRLSRQRRHHISNIAPSPTGPEVITQDTWEVERTNGRLKRDHKNYSLTLSRHDLYHLLQFIEKRAVVSESYVEVRQAVLFSEMIREQVAEQGF